MSQTMIKREQVKKVKHGVLFNDGTIRIEGGRLSYPHVAFPYKNVNDKGDPTESYSCTVLLPKEEYKEVKNLCVELMAKMMADAKLKGLPSDKKFIRDGDQSGKEEYEGMWTISARESKPPALRGAINDPATGRPMRLTAQQARDMFYGGCYGTVLIRPWLQNNSYGKRINANLLAVQFVRDGDPFGEGRIGEDAIDDSFEGTDAEDDGGWEDNDKL